MSHLVERDREFVVDIESQEQTNQQGRKYLARSWSGILNVDNGVTSSSSTTFSKSSGEDEDIVPLLGNQMVKEKRKKTATKKPPKPPRPPGGPSFDIADQKLVREISELVMVKRARRERAKAQKKAKLAKSSTPQSSSSSSSSHTSLCAMIVTLLFCLIIIFQGMLSRKGAHASFDGSPESAIVNKGALITVQYYNNPPSSSEDSGFESPSLVEQVSGSDLEQERSRGAG